MKARIWKTEITKEFFPSQANSKDKKQLLSNFLIYTKFTWTGDVFSTKVSGNSLLKFSGKVWYNSFSSNFQYESPDEKKIPEEN